MSSVKTVFEKLLHINLAAGFSEGVKIKVVNVDVTFLVSLCLFWINNCLCKIVFGSLRAKFKHYAHWCITINVCIFSFKVNIFCVTVVDFVKGFHEICVHLSHLVSLVSIKYIGLCSVVVTLFHKHALNNVLNFFNRRCFALFKLLINLFFNKAGKLMNGFKFSVSNSVHSF